MSYSNNTAYDITLKLRRGDSDYWNGKVPAVGEPCLNTDTGEIRCGDGVNSWENLKSQAKKLATSRAINGINFDGSVNITNYAECTTAASTNPKIVTFSNGFTLEKGAIVYVKFTYGNTAVNPILSVNGNTGYIKYFENLGDDTSGSIRHIQTDFLNNPNKIYAFIYDGENFRVINDLVQINTNSNAIKIQDGLLTSKLSLHYEANSDNTNPAEIQLLANDAVISSINAEQFLVDLDTVLKDVSYNDVTNDLTFTWNIITNENPLTYKTVTVPLDDLYDIYTADLGITTLDGDDHTFIANLVDYNKDSNLAGTGQLYPVKLDNNGKLVVNVPWVDTDEDTKYQAGTGLELDDGTNPITINHINSVPADNTLSSITSEDKRASEGTKLVIPYVAYDTTGHISKKITPTAFIITLDDGELAC